MTKRQIRKLAEKLWRVYSGILTIEFDDLSHRAQTAWIAVAKTAENEIQRLEATKLLRSAKRLIRSWTERDFFNIVRRPLKGGPELKSKKPKSCRIDKHGRKVCE
jgi:hypothetical protein